MPVIERLSRIIPLPFPHFMAFAPLDVWVRMLARASTWKRIPARYLLRLAGALFTSSLGTLLTLPERILLGPFLPRSPRPPSPHPSLLTPHSPPVLCVLGYFRSGTTHLHYLLSCDPLLATPRWHQVLAPHGWLASWSLLRWFLVPFLASTRPQDDVAIGPEWPAEDDFALCGLSLSSSLPGRMILPHEWSSGAAWRARHNLDASLPGHERTRFRRAVRAFAWKIAMLKGRAWRRSGGRVLLKNPSHTGRIRDLIAAFGDPPANIKFIHLSRAPGAVVRSNVAMHRRFDPFLLQPAASDDEIRRRIIDEYDATERKFLAEIHGLPAASVARLRYQDLIADPLGQLRAAYAQLELPWSTGLEDRFTRYLLSVRDYRAAAEKPAASTAAPKTDDPTPPELEWMLSAFGHDRPAVAKQPLPELPAAPAAPRSFIPTIVASLLVAAAWIGIARLTGNRLDWLTWPSGVLIGTVAATTAPPARAGAKRGLFAAALTLFTLLIAAYPATAVVFYRGREPMPWSDVWDSTRDGLLAVNNFIWLFLGIMTAYRLASRSQSFTPGAS